jgi:N6-L-threonylcarbamoyladenine synthase
MKILGIETSCDETAAAIIGEDRRIHSNIVLSQVENHAVFGGVVPEIAARAHLDHIDTVIKAAMIDADMEFSDLDGVAVTCGPGLIGGVIVGMMAAKSIAAAYDIPFLAVNHLEGHALTARLSDDVKFPYLLLLVSGGHTQILVAENVGVYKRLGTTLDDAAGECFDKCAKMMGLPFPGGPNLEKMALSVRDKGAAIERFPLPKPLYRKPGCDFSFSGLKTAVKTHSDALPEGDVDPKDAADLCYAFQEITAQVMVDRCRNAIYHFKSHYNAEAPTLVVAGGVAANLCIRGALDVLANDEGMQLIAPPLKLCSDNAAMIAWAGIERLRAGQNDALDFKARPRWPLDETATPIHGRMLSKKGVKV